MKHLTLFSILLLFLHPPTTDAQSQKLRDSTSILTLNQQIDDYVVGNNIPALDKLYADDFVFSHGSGKVEGKQSWFTSVAKGSFLIRKHDSVTAELHPAIGIVRGKLHVEKSNKTKTDRYWLKYVRVYALRNNRWWLISHVTVAEFHEAGQLSNN